MTSELLFETELPTDAADSYLGAFTLKNEWVAWLIGRAPELVAEPPSRVSQAERPPTCRVVVPMWEGANYGRPCGEAMTLRPGFWCCFRHGEPVRVRVRPKFERAPFEDVLSLLVGKVTRTQRILERDG